jgi:hypothetical protein
MSRVWHIPFIIIGAGVLVAATFGWLITQQYASATSAVAAPGQDMSRWDRIRFECDRQVQTLLTTKDLIELQRAKALVSLLDCSVSKRLPPL